MTEVPAFLDDSVQPTPSGLARAHYDLSQVPDRRFLQNKWSLMRAIYFMWKHQLLPGDIQLTEEQLRYACEELEINYDAFTAACGRMLTHRTPK